MLYQLVGYEKFTSKSGSSCTALHLIDANTLPRGEGHSVCTKVTTLPVNVKLGKVDIVFNDKGFIADVKEV